jgi:hypothetical protein
MNGRRSSSSRSGRPGTPFDWDILFLLPLPVVRTGRGAGRHRPGHDRQCTRDA